ncbi:MAG: hypothetical protein P4L53_26875 [Candidatus Obscuribacterales bacterium]|nr:hypothetical protein [Candidatus Obscuribacterales bacterium]
MRRFITLLDKALSIPINWLTQLVEKRTEKKREKFWRDHEILKNKLGSVHAKEMEDVEATIREWDEKQKR